MLRKTALKRRGARSQRERRDLESMRAYVLERAGGRCERCDKLGELEVHHIRPRSRGGRHILGNGAALCWVCHTTIHDHTAKDWQEWIR